MPTGASIRNGSRRWARSALPHAFLEGIREGRSTLALRALAGYEEPLPEDTLRSLYEDAADYRTRVEVRLDELTAAGWFLPVYRDLVLAAAAQVP